MTVAVLEEQLEHESTGWTYVVDVLSHGLEEMLARGGGEEPLPISSLRLPEGVDAEPGAGRELLGPHHQWALLLGGQIAGLHLALSSDESDPRFRPEPLGLVERQMAFHAVRRQVRAVLQFLGSEEAPSTVVAALADRQDEIVDRLRRLTDGPLRVDRIRVHGDFHLGNVLWTGKDFRIVGLDGDHRRSLIQRRSKQPAAFDLARMIRSFHLAASTAGRRLRRDLTAAISAEDFSRWLTMWTRWVSTTFLGGYLEAAGDRRLLPSDRRQLATIVDFYVLEGAAFDLASVAEQPEAIDEAAGEFLALLDARP